MERPSQEKYKLSQWGLPLLVVSWFRNKGITELFDWQVECLLSDGVLSGGNLVYSAPTSAGKTLVADFLLVNKVLAGTNKKALVIEPFVALTREKAATLKSMLFTTKVRVGAFGGTYYTPGGLAAVTIAVCTIEKANNFINKLINEEKLSDLGIIVVDEIHYLGDERRGHQLELLLTKVLFYNSKREPSQRIQIVGLSATIPNLKSIATWLNAALYVTDFRPVPLIEKIKIQDKIYSVESYIKDKNCEPLETIQSSRFAIEKDYDDLFYICIDTIVQGFSALVFCESKRDCEIMASNLASQILSSGTKLKSDNPEHVHVSKRLRENLSGSKIKDVLDKLKKCPAGPDTELVKSLKFGVGFHHAGLTSEEREIIEDGFKCGAIKTLMATSTLSSGVNLPARKVIIRSPLMISSSAASFQREMLNPITYRQMIGRAGRKGIDTCGESILICRPENEKIAIDLINASLGRIHSSLAHRMLASEGEPSGLKKAVLEVIANGTASSRDHLIKYLHTTFWLAGSTDNDHIFKGAINETLRFLISNKFIEEVKPGFYRPTRLGTAVLASGIHPDEGLEILQDLLRARRSFCLSNDLHIIFQVTPNEIARSIDLKDWQHYSKIWNCLDDPSQYVGELVGIDEIVVARRAQGFTNTLSDELERVYRRFWVALVINDLVNEMQLSEICKKYRMSKATVQQAQRAVAQYAGVISIFCQELGYKNIAALVKPLEPRISFSCQEDLLDLIRLSITRPIARCLFDAGYKDVRDVAIGDALEIEFLIRQIQPFKKEQSFRENEAPPYLWVPELAKTMSTLEYASHIVDTAKSIVDIEDELKQRAKSERRKDEHRSSQAAANGHGSELDEGPSPAKRGKTDSGSEDGEEIDAGVKPKDVPNFVVQYITTEAEVLKFLGRWTSSLTISLNFKIQKLAEEPIGAQWKRRQGKISSQSNSQDGLPLRLEIDKMRQIVKKIYATFNEDLTVYVVNQKETLKLIQCKLKTFLEESYDSSVSRYASQRRVIFSPIKLYTQDIVLTYKVLYAAFGIKQETLDRYFEWHAFDVAWWIISNCPNRGLNNRNSSLSLVAKTKWAASYHHFLHQSSRSGRKKSKLVPPSESLGRSVEEFDRLKDVVKSGKTAILQPLLNEIYGELRRRDQEQVYREVEIASRLTMAQMMIHGIGLDNKAMKHQLSLYKDLLLQLNNIAEKYYAKSSIQLTNNNHVARVLFHDLDLKKHLLEHSTVTDIAKDSTNSEILNILSKYHPFPKIVQDFRRIEKALEALQSVNTYARYNSELQMYRVFGQCDFWQTTGRVSMQNPDLFLINKNFTVTVPEHGNRPQETIDCQARKCFVPVVGWEFISADYSQLELRLLAHFSEDENLLQILNRSLGSDDTFDVFKTVASQITKKPIGEVSAEDRQHAKQICYGIIYGMGNRSLANQLGVDVERADQFRQDFFNAFPKIHQYTNDLIEECKLRGYVESLMGRRRNLPDINSDSPSLRSKAERVAVNTRIQSSASDLIKLAMKNVQRKIIDSFSDKARLVLEMHDELIYEVHPAVRHSFGVLLKETMEHISSSENLNVKLLVNLKRGDNWSTLKDFNPDNEMIAPVNSSD